MSRDPLGDRDHAAPHDQHPIVLAGVERLDDDPATPGLLLGRGERLKDILVGAQIQLYASTVVAVGGLEHDRETDPVRELHRAVGRSAAHR